MLKNIRKRLRAFVNLAIVCILWALLAMTSWSASIPGSIPISAPIAPTDTADTFPTHSAAYGKGGFRTVADLSARDAIPSARREHGMQVYVQSLRTIFTLATNLTSWIEVRPLVTVENYTALQSINATNLPPGSIAVTTGFGSIGDGGEWSYVYNPVSVATALPNAAAVGGGAWEIRGWNGDVRPCGVKGDGTTDEQAVLQVAHEAARARRLPTILPGGKTIKLGSPVVIDSWSHIKGSPGMAWIDGAFSGTKGDANGGIFRTPNALFPTWGESLVVAHTNITIENVALTRNWLSGGSHTGPLLMIDDAAHVDIRNVWLLATNHNDWATFLRGNSVHGSQIKIRTKGRWGQDGWHVYGGTNHTLVDFDIESGDDAVVAGSERDQAIENFSFGPGIAISDAGRAVAVFQATYSTTPPSPPANYVRYGVIHDIIAHGGQSTNWPVVVAEYGGANNTHTVEPPRVVSHIILDNIVTTRGSHQNGGNGALRIEGTDNVTVANCSFTNGNYSAISLNKTRNTTLRNVRAFKPVRDSGAGGSSGVDGYDKDIFGLVIDGGYYETASGLNTILLRSFTNVVIRGATIASVAGKHAIWANLGTNLMVSGNTFTGPQGINLGSGVANAIMAGNLYDASTLSPVTVNGVGWTEGRLMGKTTETWDASGKGFELLFQSTAQNSLALSDALKLNVDYPSTNAFPLKLPDGGGRWYRLAMTNSGGIPLFMGVYEP